MSAVGGGAQATSHRTAAVAPPVRRDRAGARSGSRRATAMSRNNRHPIGGGAAIQVALIRDRSRRRCGRASPGHRAPRPGNAAPPRPGPLWSSWRSRRDCRQRCGGRARRRWRRSGGGRARGRPGAGWRAPPTTAMARCMTGVWGPCCTAVDQTASCTAGDRAVTSRPSSARTLAISGSKWVLLMNACCTSKKASGASLASARHAALNSGLPGFRAANRSRQGKAAPATKRATVPPRGRLVI